MIMTVSYTLFDDKGESNAYIGNFVPTQEYEKIIATRVQSNLYYHTNNAKRGKGLVADMITR